MDMTATDTRKMEEYAARAKAQWGDTPAYKAYEAKNLTSEQQADAGKGLMELFKSFAECKDGAPDAEKAQSAVKTLQAYISEHFYPCSNEVLSGLGKLYGAGGEFTGNINAYAGDGTAQFAAKAIEAFCKARN